MIILGNYKDAKCAANTAVEVQWIPLNVCTAATTGTGYIKYSADANFNIYTSAYSDSACISSARATDVKATTVICSDNKGSFGEFGLYSTISNVYSATQPDVVFDVQSSGYMLVGAQYTDATCASPQLVLYVPLRTCESTTSSSSTSSSGIVSLQYFVDAR